MVRHGKKNYMLGKITPSDKKQGEFELYLSKINYVAQIRPSFKYLDDTKSLKQASMREQQAALNKEAAKNDGANGGASGAKKLNVVQMSAKSTHENQPRLGGALVARNVEDEEEPVEYVCEPLVIPGSGFGSSSGADVDAMDVDSGVGAGIGGATDDYEKRQIVEGMLFGDNLDAVLEPSMTRKQYLDSIVKETKVDM
ncbi:unnamed protein product [Ambrosiozyma monospora]|uniref:Unnamed protein product n=1 Tax=Ambrosiozyma monospora TaxID=43982 RepID=A0ACB5TBT6_AMBMO|nr:unnamed protein product [Ambrosiozyma monospora]